MSVWRGIGRTGRGLVAVASAELVVRLVGLAYLATLARFLEPTGFGVFNALLAYFALAVALGNFGLDRLALRELAIDPRAHRFATLLWLRAGAAVLTAVILLLGGPLLAPSSARLFGIVAIAVLPAGVASAFAVSFQAREQFGVPAAAAMAATAAMAAISLAGVAVRAPLPFYVWALVASEGVRAAWLVAAAKRQSLGVVLAFDARFARHALRAAMPFAVLTVLGALYFRIDIIMLDAMLGDASVGHYAGAYRVLEALMLVPGLVLGVLFPRFARLQSVDAPDARTLYLSVSRVLAWTGLGVAVLGGFLAEPILHLLFSEAYTEASTLLAWLMLALLFAFLHAPNVTVLFAGTDLGPVARLSFLTAGFNVAANFVMIPLFGAAGAAATTAASELLSWGVFTPMVLRRLGIPARDYGRALRSPRVTQTELRLLLSIDGTERVGEGSVVP